MKIELKIILKVWEAFSLCAGAKQWAPNFYKAALWASSRSNNFVIQLLFEIPQTCVAQNPTNHPNFLFQRLPTFKAKSRLNDN